MTPKGKTLRKVIKKHPGKKIVKRRRNKIKKAAEKKLTNLKKKVNIKLYIF